jgi:hypothetical protein
MGRRRKVMVLLPSLPSSAQPCLALRPCPPLSPLCQLFHPALCLTHCTAALPPPPHQDNAKLRFEHMAVPLDALLDAFSSVAPDGTFRSSIAKPRDRFLRVSASPPVGFGAAPWLPFCMLF